MKLSERLDKMLYDLTTRKPDVTKEFEAQILEDLLEIVGETDFAYKDATAYAEVIKTKLTNYCKGKETK